MSTIKIPYEPSPVAVTTTTEAFTTTTQAPCSGTAFADQVATTPDRAIGIPAITYSSPAGGEAIPTNLAVVTQPTKGTLKDSAGNTVSGTGNKGLDKNGTLIYVPNPDTFDAAGDSVVLRLILSCGQTGTAAVTINYVAPEEECNCNDASTTTTT